MSRGNPKPAALLVWINGSFLLAGSLSGAFVNVFLWKQRGSLVPLALFNGIHFLIIPFVFWAARSIPKLSSITAIRAGLVFCGLFYTVVLLTKQQSNVYVMGTLMGFGAGSYWFGFNLLSYHFINTQDRARFNSSMGVIAALAGVVSPLLSGFIISRFSTIGYHLVFAASLSSLVISFLASLRIKRDDIRDEAHLPAPLFKRRHPNWSRALLANLFEGGRQGVFTFFGAILVFMATGSEWALGKFSAWTALISSLSFFIVGKWIKSNWYNESMLISSFLSTAVIAVFLWGTTPLTILLYGVVTSLFTPLFAVPYGTRVFQVIDEAHEKHEKEYIVEREISLNVGRVISVAGFLITYELLAKEWIPAYVLVVGSLQVIAVLLFRRVKLELVDVDHH
ncbi:MAG: transporter [Bacilli bacterium]|nr:transporter [Bacilli bacterium]